MGPTFTAKLLPGLEEWEQGAGLGRQRQEDLKFEDSLDYTGRYTQSHQKTKIANQPNLFYHEVRLLSLVHLSSPLCNLGVGVGTQHTARACCAAKASCSTRVFSTSGSPWCRTEGMMDLESRQGQCTLGGWSRRQTSLHTEISSSEFQMVLEKQKILPERSSLWKQ